MQATALRMDALKPSTTSAVHPLPEGANRLQYVIARLALNGAVNYRVIAAAPSERTVCVSPLGEGYCTIAQYYLWLHVPLCRCTYILGPLIRDAEVCCNATIHLKGTGSGNMYEDPHNVQYRAVSGAISTLQSNMAGRQATDFTA